MDNTIRDYILPSAALPNLLASFQEFSKLNQASRAMPKYNCQFNFQAGKATHVSYTPRGLQ